MTLVYDSENGSTEWIEPERLVIKTLKGFIEREELRQMFETGLSAMKAGVGCKWLSDNRRLKAYTQVDIKWIDQDWFPRMRAAGWKYWGLVQPENAVGEIQMCKTTKLYKTRGIELAYFTELDAARRWLRTKPNPALLPNRINL